MRPAGRTLVTAPSVEPVTLAEAKLHLREDGGAQNDHISNVLIPAARQWVEKRTWRALITQTWDFTWRRFPPGRELHVPLPPMQSVTSVQYYDTDNAQQTLASSTYLTDVSESAGIIRLKDDQSWPDTYTDRPSAVVVRAICGYGDAASDVPEHFIHAMHLLIGHWYANRENVVVGTTVASVPDTVHDLLGLDHARAMIA